ncbi:MAG: hypothetical protein HQL82_04505 [Magnetococcales bacterium]|nr:hypothetical protein [Magnetococcales bacterium]
MTHDRKDRIRSGANEPATQVLDAAGLRRRFAVFGHYYRCRLDDREWDCRSVLELVAPHRVPANADGLLGLVPDLVAVMMNPGGSRPLDSGWEPPLISGFPLLPGVCRLVSARPDTTQYQIMRVLVARGWHHARVVNLSDLRQAKSPLFLQAAAQLEAQPGGRVHSLFSPERQKERNWLLPAGRTPIILGWGRSRGLMPLARQAMAALAGRALAGVFPPGEDCLCAHPSPQLQRLKEAWLEAILERLATMVG